MGKKFVINGQKPLSGTISVNGAKNFALKILPACLLLQGESVIQNMPLIEDAFTMVEIMRNLGAKIDIHGNKTFTVSTENIRTGDLDCNRHKIRATTLLIGPLLGKCGEMFLPHPGGCKLGKRPINFFVEGYKALGAEVSENEKGYRFTAKNGLKGNTIFFPGMSVTATESLILGALYASGITILENCAEEPETVELVQFLNICGANIEGAGTPTIIIHGGQNLHGGNWRVMPDRIEAGSFAILGAATNANLTITECDPSHLKALWHAFDQIGVNYRVSPNKIELFSRSQDYMPADIKTHEYPGFPSDIQPPMGVLLTQCAGGSSIFETIFDDRLNYTDILRRMGANIKVYGSNAEIKGKTPLEGKSMESPDIRAGIALVIAALIAKGTSVLDNVYQIERGYENLVPRLQAIEADIKMIE